MSFFSAKNNLYNLDFHHHLRSREKNELISRLIKLGIFLTIRDIPCLIWT
jgi:hypothetical protein